MQIEFDKHIPNDVITKVQTLVDVLTNVYPDKDIQLGIVGGALRDIALGIKPSDWDLFIVGLTSNEVIQALTANTKWEAFESGLNFSIVRWNHCEITVIESYDDLCEDRARRDLRINSLYLSYDGGSGWYLSTTTEINRDFEQGILSSDGDVDKKFAQDPIKILRVLRFAAKYHFQIDRDLHFDILRLRHLVKDKAIPKDRIFHELKKGFTCGNAYGFVRLLDEFELLEHFFPAVYALKGIDGGHYHNEQVFTHVMFALKALDPIDLPFEVKLAALYHDTGKYHWEIVDGKRRFVGHDRLGKYAAKQDLNRLRFPEHIKRTVKALVWFHMHQVDGKKSTRKLAMGLGKFNVPLKYFFWVRYADNMGSAVYKTDFMYYWKLYRQALRYINPKHVPSVKDLVINGHTIMEKFGIKQGPIIGKALSILFNKVENEELENEESALLEELKRLLPTL